MKPRNKALFAAIIVILSLLRFGHRVLTYISKEANNTTTTYYTNYLMEFSPPINQFIGKHYEEDAKFWIETPNAIQSLKTPDDPISNLQQMQTVKVNLKKRKLYGILCLSSNKYQEGSYSLVYFFMDKGQYDLLKTAINYGKQNFSIKSYLYGNFSISETENQKGKSKVKQLLTPALAEYEQSSRERNYSNPPKMEFLLSSIQKGEKKFVQFLLPDYAEIKLNYFQKNYFEIPVEEFKELLIE